MLPAYEAGTSCGSWGGCRRNPDLHASAQHSPKVAKPLRTKACELTPDSGEVPMAMSLSAGVFSECRVGAGDSSSHLYMLAAGETRATNVVGTFVGGAVGTQPGGMLGKAVVQAHAADSQSGRPALIAGGGVTL
jgi:hypothetical protein